MPTTAGGIHYPSSSDSIDIPGDLQLLAEDVETYITTNAITPTGAYTLTNKTIGNGGLAFEGATSDAYETTLTVTDPTADRTVTFQDATGTVVLRDTTDTLTNKTLTSPTVNDPTENYPTFKSPTETMNVVASAATGTINVNVETSTVWYYTSEASANFTLNFRYNSGTTLDSKLSVGESITVVFLNTNGTSAYYPSTIQVDGSAVSPKVPLAISGGNASAIDAYSFTIIKTASATFTVLETQTKFA